MLQSTKLVPKIKAPIKMAISNEINTNFFIQYYLKIFQFPNENLVGEYRKLPILDKQGGVESRSFEKLAQSSGKPQVKTEEKVGK